MALVSANSFSGQVPQHVQLSALDIVKPIIAETMVDAYGQSALMKELLYHKMQCKPKVVNNSDGWSWYDELRVNEKITVTANSGTATTNLSFTMGGSQINTLGSTRTIYPAIGDIIQDPATGQEGYIYSVVDGGVTFTVQATSYSGNWTAPSAGKIYVISSSAEFEDAQTLYKAKDSYVEVKSAKLQRFSAIVKADSDILTDELWINTTESGEYFGSWGGKQIMEGEIRMALQQVGAMWLGIGATEVAGSLPGKTQGIWQAYEAEATPVAYTAAAMTIAQARDVIEAIKGAGGYGPQTWTLPHITNEAVQGLFQSQGALTDLNINQVRQSSARLIFENVPQATADNLMRVFDVTTAILDGVTINVRLMNLSYDPNLFGADQPNNVFIRKGFCCPTARATDGNGNGYSQVEMGYKSMGPYNLMSYYGELGFLAKGGANSEANEVKRAWRSHIGFGIRGVTQCVLLSASDIS